MRVTTRLILGFGAMVISFLFGTLFALQVQQNAIEDSNNLASTNLPLALAAADMKLQAIQVQQWLTDVSATHNPDGYGDAKEAYEKFNEGLALFTKNGYDQKELNILKKDIDALYADGKKMAETYIGKGLEAGNELMEVFDESSITLAKSLDPFIEQQQNLAKERSTSVQAELGFLQHVQMIVLACSVLIGLLATWLVTRSLSNQLGAEPAEVAQAAEQIAKGNFTFSGKTTTSKPIGVYAAIMQMRDQLKKNFDEASVRNAEAEQQALAARQAEERATRALAEAEEAKREGVRHATTALESIVNELQEEARLLNDLIAQIVHGAHDQADRTNTSSNSMHEMRSTVQDIAMSASSAADVADSARQQALAGMDAVKEVTAQVAAALQQAERLKTDMASLGKQTESITEVLTVINDIADQTNLLALNAAIEAARAGDAGRGFAVVADEVRKLAEKTVTATKEVHTVLTQLQAGASKNITLVDETVYIIEQVSEKSTVSGNALDTIVTLVNDTASKVSSIASAAEEQAVASDLISSSLADVATITNTALETTGRASNTMQNLRNEVQGISRVMTEMNKAI